MDISWLVQSIFLLLALAGLVLSAFWFTYHYAQSGFVGKVFSRRVARGIYTMIRKSFELFPYFAVGLMVVIGGCLIWLIGRLISIGLGLVVMWGWYGFWVLVVLGFFLAAWCYGKEEPKQQKEDGQKNMSSTKS